MDEPTRPRRGPKKTDPEVRFFRHVDKNGPIPQHAPELGPCWMWTSTKMTSGYGSFSRGGRHEGRTGAHRWSYERFVKPIPEGYEVDHICHPDDGSCPGGKADPHRRCVNPDHLRAVPQPENNRRSTSVTARNARKTHCPLGHEYTKENTYLTLQPNGTYGRSCRTCIKARKPGLANWAKTHCPHGHEYTPENTMIDGSSGARRCKTCRRERQRKAA